MLTGEERDQLVRWSRRAKSSQALALRSRIILACGEGLSNKAVAAKWGVSQPTVGKWRARFVQKRLDGLIDEPRTGRPPSILLDKVEEVIVTTLEHKPANATHWSRTLIHPGVSGDFLCWESWIHVGRNEAVPPRAEGPCGADGDRCPRWW